MSSSREHPSRKMISRSVSPLSSNLARAVFLSRRVHGKVLQVVVCFPGQILYSLLHIKSVSDFQNYIQHYVFSFSYYFIIIIFYMPFYTIFEDSLFLLLIWGKIILSIYESCR